MCRLSSNLPILKLLIICGTIFTYPVIAQEQNVDDIINELASSSVNQKGSAKSPKSNAKLSATKAINDDFEQEYITGSELKPRSKTADIDPQTELEEPIIEEWLDPEDNPKK